MDFLTHVKQALPLGSRSALEPTSSLRLTCLLARFCRFRGERLYQRPVRCFSGLGLEMGRRSYWWYCEVRADVRYQHVQPQANSVAIEASGAGGLMVLFETNYKYIVRRTESFDVNPTPWYHKLLVTSSEVFNDGAN